jgi:hypothetical protein
MLSEWLIFFFFFSSSRFPRGGFIFFRSVEEELDETLTENTEVT